MTGAALIPPPIGTEYDYIMSARHGRIVFLAGQIAKTVNEETVHATGRCGIEVDLPTAKHCAEIAAGQVLAWLNAQLEAHETIDRILRMTVYVAVGDASVDISHIAEAASGTLIAALGEQGRHPRSVIGVARLPRNAPVLLEVTASVRPERSAPSTETGLERG